MKISGFTLLRNGTRFDYPYLESLRSLLPLVDELVINVGIGDDDTLQRIINFSKTEGKGKIILFESDWQLDVPAKKRGGLILAEQSNLALDLCSHDWCIYLQADEVIHEMDYPIIRKAIQDHSGSSKVEGLLFNYRHFYGSFDVIQDSRNVYRREVRAIRKTTGARSIGDAQSFRKSNGEKLKVIHTNARIFHYGWVRDPNAMKEKTFYFDQLYHGEPAPQNQSEGIPHTGDNYKYKRIWGLRPFLETHPQVMASRIQNKGWHWDLANSPLVFSWKDSKRVILDSIERLTGHRFFEYKSYSIIR